MICLATNLARQPRRPRMHCVGCCWAGWVKSVLLPKRFYAPLQRRSKHGVLVALFPGNRFSQGADVECHSNADAQLQNQPVSQRLIRGGKKEIKKYRERASDIAGAWPLVRARWTEAERFSAEFMAAARLGVCPRNTLVSKHVGRRPEMILAAKEFRKPDRPLWIRETPLR